MLKTFVKGLRPYTIFDPLNAEHRKLYYKFLKTHSWKNCPYRWVIDDDSVDLMYSIQRKLLPYYMKREFTDKSATTAVPL